MSYTDYAELDLTQMKDVISPYMEYQRHKRQVYMYERTRVIACSNVFHETNGINPLRKLDAHDIHLLDTSLKKNGIQYHEYLNFYRNYMKTEHSCCTML